MLAKNEKNHDLCKAEENFLISKIFVALLNMRINLNNERYTGDSIY